MTQPDATTFRKGDELNPASPFFIDGKEYSLDFMKPHIDSLVDEVIKGKDLHWSDYMYDFDTAQESYSVYMDRQEFREVLGTGNTNKIGAWTDEAIRLAAAKDISSCLIQYHEMPEGYAHWLTDAA